MNKNNSVCCFLNRYTSIPIKYLEDDIDQFEPSTIVKQIDKLAIDLLEKKKFSIYICGPVGTGKTWLSSYLGYSLFTSETKNGLNDLYNVVKFLQSSSLIRIFNLDQFGREDTDNSYNDIKKSKYLILDDISVFSPMFKAKDYYFIMFDDLIRYRYSNSLPIILTSNIKPKDLESELGSSLSSIILSKKESKTIILKGVNHRVE